MIGSVSGNSLRGTMTSAGDLRGSLTKTQTLSASVNIPSSYEKFKGPYDITPTIKKQEFPTDNKLFIKDLTVEPIPYFAVSNEFNGDTVIIGG